MIQKNIFVKVSLMFILFFASISAQSQEKQAISGQDSSFPLFTSLDSNTIKPFMNVFTWSHFNMEKMLEFRALLKPYADANDPLGLHLYARTYDLSPFGLGDEKDTKMALEYYEKAANLNLAETEHFLSDAYRWALMGLQPDYTKAIAYLESSIQHGDNEVKAAGYKELASLYYSGEDASIQVDTGKTIVFLEKRLAMIANDGWTLDFLAHIYERKGLYDKAFSLMLRSENDQTQLKAAKWLIEGKKVPKDVRTALEIIYVAAEEVRKTHKDINRYMGAENPIYLLNKLYACDKLIKKKQLKEYYMANYICPGG